MFVNCINGQSVFSDLEWAVIDHLAEKIVVDSANMWDFKLLIAAQRNSHHFTIVTSQLILLNCCITIDLITFTMQQKMLK